MSDHFIKNIEIKNFKCFKDFKAEGFGRVNLIGGKNNVGKTAFMEAVYVNAHSQNIQTFLYALLKIKASRDILDILDDIKNGNEKSLKNSIEFSNHIYTQSNINKAFYEIEERDGIKKYIFNFQDRAIEVNINDFSFSLESIKNIRFIDNFGLNKSELRDAFIAVQIRDREDILYDYINKFDKDVLNFKIIGGDMPQCKTVDGVYRDLNQLGDGLKHFISILCSLYECSGGYLFIDEVDNGIHYTKMDLFWEAVLSVSKAQNVQIFAITHSQECIESYIQVARKLKDEEISYSVITKIKSGELLHSMYDYDLLENAIIKQGHEVRGW